MSLTPLTDHPMAHGELFLQFKQAFERLTGLSLDILVPGEFRIPAGAPDFCQTMGLMEKSCEACHDMHGRLQETQGASSRTEECFAGMTSSSVPVQSQGKTIAFLHTGHVFVKGSAKREKSTILRFLKRQGFNTDVCKQTLEQVQATDPERYKSAIQLLEIFSRQLSEVFPISKGLNHYPAVEQAIRLLRKDIEKDWTLTGMAQIVNMNSSYLSEMFRKTTGKTFTSYLAHLRIEKARQLLIATKLRISEIAFASGFRSISQFNRIFKQYEAITPGDFRTKCKVESA